MRSETCLGSRVRGIGQRRRSKMQTKRCEKQGRVLVPTHTGRRGTIPSPQPRVLWWSLAGPRPFVDLPHEQDSFNLGGGRRNGDRNAVNIRRKVLQATRPSTGRSRNTTCVLLVLGLEWKDDEHPRKESRTTKTWR